MTTTLPRDFPGLWHRRLMVRPDGSRDETTRVFWLQTDGLYADIRAPIDRPSGTGRTGYGDYSDGELAALARMQGFAGQFSVDGSYCAWQREFDFQPPSEFADEANCHWEDGMLVEIGIHAPYREDWARGTPVDPPTASFRPADSGRAGLLVVAGGYFIAMFDRPAPLPPAASLEDLILADLVSGDRAAAESRFALTIEFGRIAPDDDTRWTIDLATRPWLEGTSLAVEPAEWHLAGTNMPAEKALALLR